MAAIVAGVCAVGIFLFMKACGGSSCGDSYYCVSGQDIPPPDGYERVSDIYQYNTRKGTIAAGTDVAVQAELKKSTTDGRNLSFYRYMPDTKTWEPVAAAILDPQGKTVSTTLHETPAVMAVLRRLSPAGHVVAYLGHNQQLHKEALGRITILHTLDFTPAADGTVQGELTKVNPDPSFAFYPVIAANSNIKGSIPIVSSLLATAATRTAHVQNIAKLVADNQLAGVDIAYLDLLPTDRTGFTLFIGELYQVLHSQNKMLTLTLPSPIKTQDRIDEGAYDWAELGKSADVLEIAPYRDQGTYRIAMPDILSYLTGIVQPSKLVLTVTPYATEKSADGIRTLSIADAMVIATRLKISNLTPDAKLTTNTNVEVAGQNIDKKENLTGVFWQPESACVTFTYKGTGGTGGRTIWLENAFSIGFKLEFINRYKLGGVGIEDASGNDMLGNIWTALVPFITSGQPVLLQPNTNDLQPRWRVSAGTYEDTQKGSIKWLTPAEPGAYYVYLTLSDGVSLFESEIAVNVQPASGTPSAPAGSPTPVG
jgi:spore germination protein YaaH